MTRYTKLERKPAAYDSSDFFGDKQKNKEIKQAQLENIPTSTSTPTPTVNPIQSTPQPPLAQIPTKTSFDSTSSTKKPRKRRRANKDKDQDDSASPSKPSQIPPAPAPTEPSKMLKRAKLLRLKAKKATGENAEKRKSQWLLEASKWEKEASRVNGERGGKGKGKDDKDRDPMQGVTVMEGENPWKAMERERRNGGASSTSTDKRREKRIAERNASTICFACRGQGHSAKDCQSGLNSQTTALDQDPITGTQDILMEDTSNSNSEPKNLDQQAGGEKKKLKGSETVGICFRCGSDQHSLAKCRRPVPRVGDELPFATCFVCEQKGHLSSKCPKNSTRGVYPMGGSCKLCSSIEHLAKDCELRKENSIGLGNKALEMGLLVGENDKNQDSARTLGADEDDFHELARKKAEVEKEVNQNGNNGEKKKKKIQKGKRRRDDDDEGEEGDGGAVRRIGGGGEKKISSARVVDF